ncbi:MAG: hypothetical protein FJY43_01325 [Betaproteobacteria bacterium]|nr:hypothetical protein [Betaproteobacteria bacterium]
MRALAALLTLALAGCGFQLRGAADLPFETIFVPGATGGVALDIKRNIQSGTRTRVVDDEKSAQAVLQFTQEVREKHILSLSGTGQVREFQLRYRVGFRVVDAKGGEFLPVNTIQLTRDVAYSDDAVLAKATEEQQLYRDMQFDMVQQVMRRLSGAQRPQAQ